MASPLKATVEASEDTSSHPKPKKIKGCLCQICDKVIKDAEGKQKGQDSIFCEGNCQGWLHRSCAGITKTAFQAISSVSFSDRFLCLYCKTTEQDEEIKQLKETIVKLELKLAEQSTLTQVQGTTDSLTYAKIARDTQLPDAPTRNQDNKTSEERRFNFVMYGMKECQKGTSRQDRIIQDTDSATSIIANIDNQFTAQSVRDCFRLGKYTEGKSRPTLVKLTRAQDVTYTF